MRAYPLLNRRPKARSLIGVRKNVFEIEFVAARGGSEPEVVEKMASAAARLVDADKTAKLLLERVRQKRRADGYQIRAHDGRVVLRFLERWSPATSDP